MTQSNIRKSVKILLDTLIISFGFVAAFFIKYDLNWAQIFKRQYMAYYIIVYMCLYFIFRMQTKSWHYTNILDMYNILGLNIGTAVVFFLGAVFFEDRFPKHLLLLIVILCSVGQLLARHIFRLVQNLEGMMSGGERPEALKKVAIIGVGELGEHIARESLKNKSFKYEILGFIDDDPKKVDLTFYGYRVLGRIKDLKKLIMIYEIEELIIASSLESDTLREINSTGYEAGIEVKILPSFNEILQGKSLFNQVRDVKIEDLLGRSEEKINSDSIRKLVEGKVVFVTGGAGSIGSELCRQLAKYNPKSLVVLDINENAAYFLELELQRRYPNLDIISEICSIRDMKKLHWLFERYCPNLVFHAAAHKHVPLMERNPEEAIKNNIFGTKNIAECSHTYGVDRFVLVSTDKAVNPTNVMGATKRVCELVIQEFSKKSKTKYMAVRFGNVLGSNGSVIPLFKQLIDEKKNLTVTHPDVTRYFMTIPEAASLVVETGALGDGGEVFILDMGKSIKIMDLAKNLIQLSGLNFGEDIDIDIVGLRPGEKLYEELLYDVDAAMKTENKKIFIAKLQEEDVKLEYHLEKLKGYIEKRDVQGIKDEMKMFVPSYREPEHHFEKRKESKEDLGNKGSVEAVSVMG